MNAHETTQATLAVELDAVIEDFRQAMLAQPMTEDRDTYSDGYGSALAHVVTRLRAVVLSAEPTTNCPTCERVKAVVDTWDHDPNKHHVSFVHASIVANLRAALEGAR